MRTDIIIVISIIIFLVSSTVPSVYWYHFRDYPISDNPERWGMFGDYMGGILNPILSFFAFCGLLITIIMQNQQISQIDKQLKLEDIYKALTSLDNDFWNFYIKSSPSYYTKVFIEKIIDEECLIPMNINGFSDPYITRIVNAIEELTNFLQEYTRISGENSAVFRHYRLRYRDVVDVLKRRGYLTQESRDLFNIT